MKFSTHEKRMRHPLAKLIPQILWETLFVNELPNYLIPLMQEHDEHLLNQLIDEARPKRPYFTTDMLRMWLVIVLSHPELTTESLQQIADRIGMTDQMLFHAAVLWGNKNYFKYLMKQYSKSSLKYMITENNYHLFIQSAQRGDLYIFNKISQILRPKLQQMIEAKEFSAFKLAAENGHLSILKFLAEKAPEKLQQMILADNFFALRRSVEKGHLSVLKFLVEKASEKQQEMYAVYHLLFRIAAAVGHLSILQFFAEKSKDNLQEMISSGNYSAFKVAAAAGHLSVLQFLTEKAPDELPEMIKANNYFAFRHAAINGYLPVVQYLAEIAPEKLQEMIAAQNYASFRCAAADGRLSVIKYLSENAHDILQDMIEADNYGVIRGALQREKETHLINYLLSIAHAFAFADQHYNEYFVQVSLFVTNKLSELQLQKRTVEQENPYAVFDITNPDESKLLFYILRNLIRQNDPARRDDILFLLNIPSVKALAHTEVTPHKSNELLRLALSLENESAAEILMGIPAVREMAVQNNFYRLEQQSGLDLQALAQDRESAMTALTQGEQQRLKKGINYYKPMLKQASVQFIMEELYAMLAQLYEQNPASITILNQDHATTIVLPLHWEELQNLHLGEPVYHEALKAYYQHKAHSAWRYLSKPNPWMHEHASYVYVNPYNTQEKWSTFEEYQSLISMLYLAVLDKTMPCLDNHTFESRLEHFINELAFIGRAHNWDTTRSIIAGNGDVITQEFDDLEGDRPSCFSGVKRRLFQSVLDHPFFMILTEDIIKQEIREFVRQHFKDSIDDKNRNAIKTAWEKGILLEERTNEDWAALNAIDICQEKLDAFIRSLKNKYDKEQLVFFIPYIKNKFALNPDKEFQRAHLLKFGYLHLEELFESNCQKKEKNQSELQGLNQFGLFAPGEPLSTLEHSTPRWQNE
ncbi:ankyrin repeat protein [Legionella wadsworthii]|uniref:Ankyrin repeat protein n=1 Tax=Legionella wadsworthii TaxID=28088 RepID=A0A378LNW5_9GAMM|nr:ankyrin repeat domain-containing protein [Legionella wadsworthii]STY28675.1 ankyrin repeat protein [Legionella wadsworthii]